MASILEALDELASKGWCREWQNPAWKQFVLTGDEKQLTRLPKFTEFSWLPSELYSALGLPSQIDDNGKRFLKACHAAGHPHALGPWIQRGTMAEGPGGAQFVKACEVAKEIGCPKPFLATQVAEHVRPLFHPGGAPTPAGQFLLALEDDLLEALFLPLGSHPSHPSNLAELFVSNARPRWRKLLERLNKHPEAKQFNPAPWILGLEAAPNEFLELTAEAFGFLDQWYARFLVGEKLCAHDAARFGPPMEKLTVGQLLAEDTIARRLLHDQACQAAGWLIANRGTGVLPHLKSYFAAPLYHPEDKMQSEYKTEALKKAAQVLGRDAIPLFEACFATPQPEVQLQALQLWASLAIAADTEAVAPKLRELLRDENAGRLARAVRLAGDLFPEAVEEDLWSLLSHKSRPVRDAAACTLAKLGESRLSRAADLWAARRVDTRLAAVAWLKALGTAKAATVLKARLEEEEADDVRDAILLALEKLQDGPVEADPAGVQARIKKTLSKVDGSPVVWLDPKRLPAVKLKDGSKLPPEWLLYLLYRQSRVKDMRPDIEAKPIYSQLDRRSSGELASAVLQAFFGSKIEADDRWTMAFAAIVGDDRLVPVFTRQIKEWADNMRGKLAEYAVQALALLGTDSALLAVDALAIRYRSKNKNIGKAASDAFAEAARVRGLTVEELGDLVVPWLGFKPGEPRVVDSGKTKLEAHIGSDFKLTFRDVATNKKVAKLPDSAPAEVKAEFKELSAGLKEAVKSQLLRMETLMVRQFRWPMIRWQELYLQHPLLLPFAQRLVWGAYDESGKLAGTFRVLEDHSLTDAADEPYNLPKDCTMGVVHPLELTPESRQAWLKHLADYDVVPPFAQLDRPVVTVEPGQRATKFGREVAETELNAMTFKGRAERLGWTRGSVCDAGGINYYVKSFPAGGVDVFVETEGMYVGIDMYTDIKLGRTFFVKHGSVKIGSYEYDEPSEANDSRLLSYGAVPSIAFSEAMGDLVKIAGKTEVQPQEAAHA